MSCIVLVGGIIGGGKTTFIKFLQENKIDIFNSEFSYEKVVNEVETQLKSVQLCTIILDEICSIEEQAQMMETLKGWRHFRVDLLMAAEHFMSYLCESKSIEYGPLTERSLSLLEKLSDLNPSLVPDLDVIFFVEDNFYYRSMRYDWFQIARRANIGFCEIFVKCEIDRAICRNSQRGYSIPEDKIKRMILFMEYPEPEKYKWEKHSVIFNSENKLEVQSLKEVIECIKEASKNPAEMLVMGEKIEARAICSKNVVHQADNIIRKLISKIISSNKVNNKVQKEDLKKIIADLFEVRQNLLQSIRQGFVSFPQNLLLDLKSEGINGVKTEFEKIIVSLFEEAWNKNLFDKSCTEADMLSNFDALLLPVKNLHLS